MEHSSDIALEFDRTGNCKAATSPFAEAGTTRFAVGPGYRRLGTLGDANTVITLALYESTDASNAYGYSVCVEGKTKGSGEVFLCRGALDMAALVKALAPLWCESFMTKGTVTG